MVFLKVLSTNGDTKLGGTDMDNQLIDWVVNEFNKQEGVDLSKDSIGNATCARGR